VVVVILALVKLQIILLAVIVIQEKKITLIV